MKLFAMYVPKHSSKIPVVVLIHTCKREQSSAHLVCPWRHNAQVHSPHCHLDWNLFLLGLLLGKPRGVDPSYQIGLNVYVLGVGFNWLKAKGENQSKMLRQQMQNAILSICQSALSLSQLRLVHKVGQWDQLSLRVVQLQKYYNLNKLNYP